jgi:biotin carboxylase
MYSAVGNAGYLYKHPQAQQIGHMFAHANKRSASIPKLAAALLDLGVLGEVACDAKHLARMLEEPAFISIAHNTALVNGENQHDPHNKSETMALVFGLTAGV